MPYAQGPTGNVGGVMCAISSRVLSEAVWIDSCQRLRTGRSAASPILHFNVNTT